MVRVSMDRTAVVEMVWKKRSRLYPENKCLVGDTVRIEETRPISKSKHWRLMEILSRRQVADVRAIDLESDAVMVTTAEEPQDAEEAADDAAEQDDEQDTEDESSSDEQDAE